MKILIVLSVLVAVSTAKILGRCKVVDIIKTSQLNQFTQYSIADWVCLAYHASGYNTMEVGRETKDGNIWATDYGIFQISSRYWCNNDQTPDAVNGCGIKCSELLGDDLQPDIECAAKIVNQVGMEAWSTWVENCKGKWINYYTFFCF